jgi:hypothetical protein
MKLITLKPITAPLVLLVGVAIGVPALAGSVERDCNMLAEAWLSPSVKWTFCTGPNGQFLAPGFPDLTCPNTGIGDKRPGLQSFVRAQATWNNAALPSGALVSRFELIMDPSLAVPAIPAGGGFASRMNNWGANNDTLNLVTFWENASTFSGVGGTSALALSQVALATGTRDIVECDIAFQALSTNAQGRSIWSYVETNTTMGGVEVATDATFQTSFLTPINGYVDIEGVLVHEFGHFAGLAHSLVDSSAIPGASLFPTMFDRAQADNYNVTLQSFVSTNPCVAVSSQSNGANPPFLVRLGASARTLELDDLTAIAEAYPRNPGDPFYQQSGTLVGTVSNGSGTTFPSVSVVAYDPSAPDVHRAGTITYAGGFYTIVGLPPGQYNVYIESIDSGLGTNSYFPVFGSLPEFATSCGPLSVVPTEFWSTNDGAVEFSNMVANSVQVVAGTPTTADFVTNSAPNNNNDLGVWSVAGGTPVFSSRGTVAPVGTTIYQVQFRIQGAAANSTVQLALDLSRTNLAFANQLLQVFPTLLLQGQANGAGVAVIPWTVPSALANSKVFAQGAYTDASGSTVLTNVVDVWYLDT